MRDVVPDHVKYCFQSPFEQKFQQTKFGDWHRPSISVGFLYENHRSNAQVLDANRCVAPAGPASARLVWPAHMVCPSGKRIRCDHVEQVALHVLHMINSWGTAFPPVTRVLYQLRCH